MKVARLGDRTIGRCFCHLAPLPIGGTIITASPDTFANGLGVARIGDVIKADCGHTAKIITSSPDVYANSRGVARVGDRGDGCYKCTIITGSPDVYANG